MAYFSALAYVHGRVADFQVGIVFQQHRILASS
jgi:hypothetical protein